MAKWGGGRKKKRNKKIKIKVRGGYKSQNCKFRHSLETAEVSISHWRIGSELCDHEYFDHTLQWQAAGEEFSIFYRVLVFFLHI